MLKHLVPLLHVHVIPQVNYYHVISHFPTLLCEYVRDIQFSPLIYSVVMVHWCGESQTGVHHNCSVNYLIVSICPSPLLVTVFIAHMNTPVETSSIWRRLSMREIIDVLPGPIFSSKEKRCRAKLEEAVMQLPAHQ